MRLVRTILLVVLALAVSGCFNITIPDPPDINIHGEVNNGENGNGHVETDKDND